ncbi:MAG TPA: DUF695 domain-containing protein, partial [Planctomycetaceae bacterium]|nr:DUF695 domain-containing protein [Planctomycetaceae bacterium]
MAEDWEFYLKPVDDHPASIFVDLGQKEIAPDASRPWLLRVSVALQSRRDDGLSDRDEADVLNAIEDKLFVAVARGLRARYVGRITTQGRREHFYYGPSAAGFPEAVATAMGKFPLYEFTCRDEEDREWTTYSEVLHPDALERQSIQNRRVVNQLAREGDDLTEPREVDHWAYFPSEEARDRFLLQIAGNRFRSEPCPAEAPEGRLQYGVHLRRSDRVDFETIDAIAIDLFLRAADCEGEYD